jgi:glycerol-3-phosphate acyltransferase PlsY
MKQRWALVAMGAWLAGTICMSVVATENFYTIDRLLAGSPSTAFTALVRRLGQPQARELLR